MKDNSFLASAILLIIYFLCTKIYKQCIYTIEISAHDLKVS